MCIVQGLVKLQKGNIKHLSNSEMPSHKASPTHHEGGGKRKEGQEYIESG